MSLFRIKKAAGFTLIELLLVLVLIGIGTGLAIVSVDRLAGRAEERRWMDRTQQELRRLRNKAVLSNLPVRGTVVFGSGKITTRTGAVLTLPERYRFSPLSPDKAASTTKPPEEQELLFFPDGSMEEAHFALVTPSGMQQGFHMTPISGRIERRDVEANPR